MRDVYFTMPVRLGLLAVSLVLAACGPADEEGATPSDEAAGLPNPIALAVPILCRITHQPYPIMRYTLLFSLLLAVGCADAPDTAATNTDTAMDDMSANVPDDLSATGSASVESLLADDPIHVHRVTLAPGDSLPPHEGGERIVYALTDLPALVFATDGEREERSFGAGEVHRHDAGIHSVTNEGEAPAEFVVFERRGVLPETASEGDTDIPEVGDGVTDEVLLDDAFAEVHRITLQPSAALPPHQGYARAVYSLSGYTVEFTGPDGTREQRFETGEAHTHAPGDHTVENAGDTIAEFLVVEFKR